MKLVISLFLILFTIAALGADDYQRTVSLEWEPIEGAAFYDIELRPLTNKDEKTKVITIKKSEWSGKLSFGKFQMRIRAKDLRKVPGEWSAPEEFEVGLESAQLISPNPEQKVTSKEDEFEKVKFEWKPIGGAEKYKIEVVSADEKTKIVEETSDTDIQIKLPVAQTYIWSVVGLREDLASSSVQPGKFHLHGGRLEKPKITEPETKFVRLLEWNRPEFSETYDYSIQRLNPNNKRWEKIAGAQKFADNKIPFDPKWKGGQYRISVRANSEMRSSSEIEQLSFPVADGDRSPAAEEVAILRESIDRTTGWYFTASYLVTGLTYKGIDYDTLGTGSLKTAELPDLFGGTGRLGLGYLDAMKPWGFVSIVDYSGFLIADSVYNFGSLEANAVYRLRAGSAGEFRQYMGVYYKELPALTNLISSTNFQVQQVVSAGPHYGAEYWWAMNKKLGLQVNGHVYFSLLNLKTPNGNAVKPTLTYQLGLLGSYRLSARSTGLMGYAFRSDSLSYESSVGGNDNSVTITGHYLNFLLEWAL